MNMVPHYVFPAGTVMDHFGQKSLITGAGRDGYQVIDLESSRSSLLPLSEMVERLKQPGMSLIQEGSRPSSETRLGHAVSFDSLPLKQRNRAKAKFAACVALQAIEDALPLKAGKSVRLTEASLNDEQIRKQLHEAVRSSLTKSGIITGGKDALEKLWKMPRGRKLNEMFKTYQNLQADENPLSALADLDHRKGNRIPRLQSQVMTLLEQAEKDVGRRKIDPSIANIHSVLKSLIWKENKDRKANELNTLVCPSQATLKRFRRAALGPTGELIASKGSRHARNKRGRGSTDIRALLSGEVGIIDECKISLVVCLKLSKRWANLSKAERKEAEELDKKLFKRIHLLVLLDIATRMPLAWVVTENPGADATIALIRMAMRCKMREKLLSGAQAFPMPPVGIGRIKIDNGPGLRNAKVIRAAIGLETGVTMTRAYQSTDRPYIERLFGTLESVLFKPMPGYTGRKAGDLPDYDSMRDASLDTEMLTKEVSRFLIDEYPHMLHQGVGLYGKRPIEMWRYVDQEFGTLPPPDEHERRARLGYRYDLTPNDEGLNVLGVLRYNSDALQLAREDIRFPRKVALFVDPDNVNIGTVRALGFGDIEVQLSNTYFKDMTMFEVREHVEDIRRERPDLTELYEDTLLQARLERFERNRQLTPKHTRYSSYISQTELDRAMKATLGGAHILTTRERGITLPGTVMAGALCDLPEDDDLLTGEFEEGMTSSPETPAEAADPQPEPKPKRSKARSKSALALGDSSHQITLDLNDIPELEE